ncbi:class IV lanthionine synthetase LanL [Streptomyces sp. PA03-5A]|nr:class IV lanthionine synthetase LanL [Streptomyces sp. PA03-5A]
MSRPTQAETSTRWAEELNGLLAEHDASWWETHTGDHWFQVRPVGHRMRNQGWKIHLSATVGDCDSIVRAALPVLVEEQCAFKFVRDAEVYRRAVSRQADRSAAGKLFAVYPDSDGQFRRLVRRLHAATEQFAAPHILTDRQYQPGSCVQYRYGTFAGTRVLDDAGLHVDTFMAPDGSLVPDERNAWFDPPPWAVDPFDTRSAGIYGAQETAGDDQEGGDDEAAVVLADRYRVTDALRHTSKGGVYRAVDQKTGDRVIIKQARPHIDTQADGGDARDLLRNEARMLERLASTGYVPRLLDEFGVDDDLFLVQEELVGDSLQDAVDREAHPALRSADASTALSARLVDMLAAVHRSGVVLRDLAPGNVMLTSDGGLRLIDLETAAETGAAGLRLGTPFFAAPEQRVAASDQAPRADPAVDRYSLGALIFFLVVREGPWPTEDVPADRTIAEQVAQRLAQAAHQLPEARVLAPVITGLMEREPDKRLSLDGAAQALTDAATTGAKRAPEPAPELVRGPAATEERVIADTLTHLVDSLDHDATWLWPVPSFGTDALPGSLQCGAAGGAGVLVQAWRLREQLALDETRWRRALVRATRWFDGRLQDTSRVLPGLYSGHAGISWAAYELADTVEDEFTAARATALALRLPVRWPNPDLMHGLAGAGTALLRLWRLTGDPSLRERWRKCAEGLAEAASYGETGIGWRVREMFPTPVDRGVFHGFAHGTAGIGSFLLSAAAAGAGSACRELAQACGETLVAAAVVDADTQAAFWSETPQRPLAVRQHWCHGSAGVGTFLTQLWQATGTPRYRELAEGAARAVVQSIPFTPTGHCHGLAGYGHFLLDLAEATGDPAYTEHAQECADSIVVRHVRRDGLWLLPSDNGLETGFDYGTGMPGPLSFLLRLRHGGPHPWTPSR